MLSRYLLELVRDWCREANPHYWLFPGRRDGSHLTTRQLIRVCHETARAADVRKRVTPHILRHSFATHLLEQNVDVRIIQVLLGHARLDSTALYTRVALNTILSTVSPLDHIVPKLQSVSLKPDIGQPPSDEDLTNVQSG